MCSQACGRLALEGILDGGLGQGHQKALSQSWLLFLAPTAVNWVPLAGPAFSWPDM